MKRAHDKIEGGAYQEASKLWKQEINNPKTKISSRACYNLAVLSEFNGDLNNAMKWAAKAYDLNKQEDTGLYIKDLENRLARVVDSRQVASTEFQN